MKNIMLNNLILHSRSSEYRASSSSKTGFTYPLKNGAHNTLGIIYVSLNKSKGGSGAQGAIVTGSIWRRLQQIRPNAATSSPFLFFDSSRLLNTNPIPFVTLPVLMS
jgi:hypothetical protein